MNIIKEVYYKVYAKLDELKDNIIMRCQRFIRGYATHDAYHVDEWFIDNCLKILIEVRKNNQSIPAYFLAQAVEEKRQPTKQECKEAFDKWMSIIDRMIELLKIMHKDINNNLLCNDIDKCKDEFFILFSRYFWMIGY